MEGKVVVHKVEKKGTNKPKQGRVPLEKIS